MNLKNFIKKKLEKDNTRYLIVKLEKNDNYHKAYYSNLTELIKYLKKNERNIESIHINLLI